MRASFALFAAIAAPTYALKARSAGQDSSNFLQDTAPQGQSQDSSNFLIDTAPQPPHSLIDVITQISDGQPQAPTVAPPGLPSTILPSIVVPTDVITSQIVEPPAPTSIETPEVSLPVESIPPVLTSLPVESTSELPPLALDTSTTLIVIPTPSIIPPGVSPNGTLPVPTTVVAPSNTGSTNAPNPTPSDVGAASSMQAFSTFGLVAAIAAIVLV